MVMDEAGRNGENWHLAQQLAQPVIIQKQQTTQPVISYRLKQSTSLNHIASCITIISTQIWMGDFYFSYKYPPPYAIIIIYNLLTNRWLKYGIIR